MKHKWVEENRVLPMMSHSPCLGAPHFDPATDNVHAASTQVNLSNMKNLMLCSKKIPTRDYYMMYINAKWKHTLTIIAGVSDVSVEIAGGVTGMTSSPHTRRLISSTHYMSSLSGKYVHDVCNDPDVLCWSFISSANAAMLSQRTCHH